jgi:hypothetical protein
MTSNPATPSPAPTPALMHALQVADFADAESMSVLRAEIIAYARTLRAARKPQSVITYEIRALVDDSLPARVVRLRTSEDRGLLLGLAAEWSAAPVT